MPIKASSVSVKLVVRLPEDLHGQLVAKALEEERSLNNLITRLLRRALTECPRS